MGTREPTLGRLMAKRLEQVCRCGCERQDHMMDAQECMECADCDRFVQVTS